MADQEDVQDATEQDAEELVNIEDEVKKFEQKDQAREGYERRKEKTEEGSSALDEDAIVDRITKKLLPALKVQNEGVLLENKLDRLTTDPVLQKLIRFHLENTVNPSAGSIDDRLEIAYAAANRKKILKANQELTIALKNRQQISNNGQGQGTETTKVSDGLLGDSQIQELKKKGWDDKKIERFKQNLQRNSGR